MEILEEVFMPVAREQGANIIKTVYPVDILFDIKTTFKCITCEKYGVVPTCPPRIPGMDYFKELIKSYKIGLIVGKTYKYKDSKEYNKNREESGPRLQAILIEMEKQAFNRGYYWAISFTGGSCRMCKKCNRDRCLNPDAGRIPMEATGIDVVATCAKLGLNISFPHPSEKKEFCRIGLFLL